MTASEQVLPQFVGADGGLVVRERTPDEAAGLIAAVTASIEHLRPWMSWASEPPLPLARWRERLREWARQRLAGGDALYGIFVDGVDAGGCGLHRRLGPAGLEIGYWVHAGFVRRGLASTASRLLTDAAFEIEGVELVEIHHDKANLASAGVPRRLGYTLVAEVGDRIEAPDEVGIECRWRVTREQWAALRAATAQPRSPTAQPGAGPR